MTVEQLNIIITAQTTDFQEKLAAVNEALRETVSLAEQAAAAAAGITGSSVTTETKGAQPQAAETGSFSAGTENIKPQAAEVFFTGEKPIAARADTARQTFEKEQGGWADSRNAEESLARSPQAASVPRLNRSQTVMGAISQENSNQSSAQSTPIEIHTTVELDGDSIGEAVYRYNGKRTRITDGF